MDDIATSRVGASAADLVAPQRRLSLGDGLEAAEAARNRGDDAGALNIVTALRDAFPEHPAPMLRAAAILSQLRRFDEAEALLADGAARFPTDIGFAIESAWAAHRRGDFAGAAARFALVRQDLPNHPVGFTGAALALRDSGDFAGADALLCEAIARLPDEPGPSVDHAWVAHVRRDWPEAAARWQRVRERHEALSVGYTAGAVALREAGRLDDAAALLDEATARFPDDPAPAIERAWLAHHRRDWDDAIRLWQTARNHFPDQIAAYTGAAQALREGGRLDDAEALLAAGIEQFPGHAGLRVEHATLASRRRDWTEAARRWQAVRALFPDHPASYTGAAQAWREQRRFDEAGAVLAEALQRFARDPAVRSEYAWLAQFAGDWPEAARRWQDMRERHPDHSVGYTSGAVALREQRRFDEAEALLAEAVERFPGERAPLAEHAWLAMARRDWPAAARRWAELRRRHPDSIEGYLRGAQALATMWQHDEAEQVLADGMARFPDDGGLAGEHAWVAFHRHENEAAVQRFAAMRSRFPDLVAGYTGGAMALRNLFRLAEAEALLQEAQQRFPDDPKIPFEYAQIPMFHPLRRERDPEEALRRLARLRERFPDFEDGWVLAMRYLREIGRVAQADALAQIGMEALPRSAGLALEYANNARERTDWTEAVRRYAAAQAAFPDHAGAAIGLGASLSAAGRHDDAEPVWRAATERFPNDGAVFAEFGQIAARRGDWPAALARWTDGQQRFPDQQEFAHRIFEAELQLLEGGPADAAGGLFRLSVPANPQDDDLDSRRREQALERLYRPHAAPGLAEDLAGLCDIASDRIGPDKPVTLLSFGGGIPSELSQRFGSSDTRFVDLRTQDALAALLGDGGFHPTGTCFVHYGGGLGSSALFVLARLWPALPEQYFLIEEFGRDAVVALHDFAAAFPVEIEFIAQTGGSGDPPLPQAVFGRMRHAAGDAATSVLEPPAAPREPAATAASESQDPRAAMREIVMQFESLGGTSLGCEFGMFQREFGAEPLGLLRWADMPYDGLILALENRFEGVGSPENTELFVNRENARPEYCTRDLRGFMFMRAFIYEDEMPFERMWKQALRRLGFLRDKLIGDLESGSKIFTYRLTKRNLDPAELARLHAAVRSYGDNMLFYVRYEDAEHPNGTVELAAPGLMIGYIDRFKITPDGQLSANPPSASWMALCTRAQALWRDRSAAAAAA
jgi:tetratricopeptide (TPR) repeat protein